MIVFLMMVVKILLYGLNVWRICLYLDCIEKHRQLSGKSKGLPITKTLKRGQQFMEEGYIKFSTIYTSINNNCFLTHFHNCIGVLSTVRFHLSACHCTHLNPCFPPGVILLHREDFYSLDMYRIQLGRHKNYRFQLYFRCGQMLLLKNQTKFHCCSIPL